MDPDPSTSAAAFLLQHAPTASLDPAILAAEVVLFLFLLLASALFSGSEVALFSLDTTAKENLAERGDKASLRILTLMEQPRQVLITILLLNTVVNVTAAILAAVATAQVAATLGWPPTLTLFVEVVALTFVLLVVSEITPKLIATRHAVEYSRKACRVLWPLHHLLKPISRVLSRAMQSVQNALTTTPRPLSPDDLKAMAEIGEAHGTLEVEERELIHSIVEFGETAVREIMISRLDVVALSVKATLPQALNLIRASGHSRLPLYLEHLDSILGIVYAKDLLPLLGEDDTPEQVDWTRLARAPLFVPHSKKLGDLLNEFRLKKTHMAIVVDEYGGTAGLVTMEDLLEEVVGDIRDEHDENEAVLYEQLDESLYRFEARIDLDDLNEILDLDLDTESFDFETLGGLILHVTGAIPKEGTEAEFGPLHMTVESTENHRIGQVRVETRPEPVEAASPPEADRTSGVEEA